MRLRLRLAVVTVAFTVPMVCLLIVWDAHSRHQAAQETLAHLAHDRMNQPGERERCERDPAAWGREQSPLPLMRGGGQPTGRPTKPPPGPRGAPPVFYAYNAGFVSENPRAPALSAGQGAALQRERGRDWVALDHSIFGEQVAVLTKMPWAEGPCAVVAVYGTTVPGFLGAVLPASEVWLGPLMAVIGVVLLALGPVVQKLRKLTKAVRASVAGGFQHPPEVRGTDEIAELGQAFAAASAEVHRQLAAREDRERALREFLANTTHDVMMPLTVLMQHLAALKTSPIVDSARIGSAIDEAHYLTALIQNLSTSARLDVVEPQLERGPVDLGELVGRVEARHRTLAQGKGVVLVSGVPESALWVEGDLTFIEQAVSNLVYNAIHYNRAGGHVAVVLDRAEGSQFVLRVLDDGPGIAPDELTHLVERGFRGGANRGKTASGHGLGLHITHTVARLHGFGLRFANRDEGGLEVTLSGSILKLS